VPKHRSAKARSQGPVIATNDLRSPRADDAQNCGWTGDLQASFLSRQQLQGPSDLDYLLGPSDSS
jgi:hypothetical protein